MKNLLVTIIIILFQTTVVSQNFKELEKNANKGEAKAQFKLGYKYQKDSILLDLDKAIYWYKKSAEQDFAIAQSYLGSLLFNDFKDMEKAFYWLEKSANNGDSLGEYYMGLFYSNGIGFVDKNERLGFYWYKKSAENNNSIAQFLVAINYFYGIGTLIDKKKSASWMRKSYENGYQDAKNKWEELELWKY